MPRTTPTVRHRVLIALVALALAATGCGVGAPRSIDPSGIDGLEIPTPSPDSGDFVDRIENPRLPLAVGSEWTYERTRLTGRAATITVTVPAATREIDGVVTTPVTTTVAGRAERRGARASSTEYFAQDRAGNVWAFGADDWLAGVDGAEAGLVMPALPRVGDGFRQGYAAGVAESHSEVLDVATSAQSGTQGWDDVVEIRETDPLAPRRDALRFYAPGVGLVLSETAEATTALVSHAPTSPAP